MLCIHPKLTEEIIDFIDEYMELDDREQQAIRRTLVQPRTCPGSCNQPHVLGGTQQPQQLQPSAYAEMMEELQINAAISANYSDKRDSEPLVTYWVRIER